MEKIIQGKRYNTKTAAVVAKNNETTLYRKKTGEHFTYDGKEIIRLKPDEAKELAKKLMTKRDYELIFEISNEDDVGFNVRIPESLHQKLVKYSEEKQTGSVKHALIEILYDGLN